MTVTAIMTSEQSFSDDMLERAVALQKCAKDNHGITLEIGHCLDSVVQMFAAYELSEMREQLDENLIEIANGIAQILEIAKRG